MHKVGESRSGLPMRLGLDKRTNSHGFGTKPDQGPEHRKTYGFPLHTFLAPSAHLMAELPPSFFRNAIPQE